jgi:LysM repeat protein
MNLFPDKKYLLLFLVLACARVLLSQEPVPVERSNNKVILEGKVYYIHVVKPGQTLYSIAKAYNISQKEIAIENPGAVSGLQIGQALKIPLEHTMDDEIDTSEALFTRDSVRLHTIQPGETVFSISRMYGLDAESILLANPGIDIEDLQPGQKLVIPEVTGTTKEPAYNEEGFAYHRVKRRETLYSIARYYDVPIDEIREANPELGWGSPKTGQVIRIPLPQVIDHPEMVLDTVFSDTLLQAETDTVVEEYTYEDLRFSHADPDRVYRIAYFIPFDFREPEPLDSLIRDVKSAASRNRIIERYRREQLIPQSVNFLEFFEGSLLAIDSLSRTGMKLDIKFYDTRKSAERTRSILEHDDLKTFDLIVGPFYTYNLQIVADFARRYRIPLVTPFYDETDLVSFNPFLFQPTPSTEAGYRQAARLIASRYAYNIVYVREADSLEMEKHRRFKEYIFDALDDYHPEEPVIFKEVVLQLTNTDEIVHSLSADKKNLVVVPTRNEALASRVVSSLYFKLKEFDIELLGTPFWPEFSSIDYRYFHDLKLIFYHSQWIDYLDPEINRFLACYRSHFYGEPQATTGMGINYGISGFDLTYYFINALRLYGPRFILSLDDYHPELVAGGYRFARVTSYGGYENEQISFYQFMPDMTIRKIEIPEIPRRRFFFRPLEDRRRKYLDYDPRWD